MSAYDKLAPESHEITFTLTEQDAWFLLKSLDKAFPGTPGHPAPRWRRAFFAILKWSIMTLPTWLLVSIVLVIASTDTPIKMWQVILVAIVGLTAGFLMAAMMPERKIHPFVRAFMGLKRPLTIALSHDGIRKSNEGSLSFIPWEAYLEVELSNGFIIIYRGHVADFIPISAFSTEEHADEFARFIALHIKAAQSRT